MMCAHNSILCGIKNEIKNEIIMMSDKDFDLEMPRDKTKKDRTVLVCCLNCQ